jgi:hypothetical protein
MTHRRKLLAVLIASAVLSCVAAAGAMYLATARYEQATRDTSVERFGYILNRYVNETVWQLFAAEAGMLARDIAQEGDLRRTLSAGDTAALKALLPGFWGRNVVSNGQIVMLGVTVYRPDGSVLAEHSNPPGMRVAADVSDLLGKRQDNARLQELRHVSMEDGAPRLSVVAPIGGLRLIGYVGVHVSPLTALRNVDDSLGMRIAFSTLDGQRKLAELGNYKLPDGAKTLRAELTVAGPTGEPAFRATVISDETRPPTRWPACGLGRSPS